MKQKASEALFFNKEIDQSKRKSDVEYDVSSLYERANDELALQQSKRDQIITLYLAVFSFLVPFALQMELVSWQIKGLIFLAVAAIGFLFSMIIIRYRVYKEAYWLCCQSLTVLMNFKHEEIDKPTVQAVYYQSMRKKGISYVKEEPDGKKKFRKWKYFTKNVFSAETLHFIIQSLITSITFGLSCGLIAGLQTWLNVMIGVAAGIGLMAVLLAMYFRECRNVYAVLVDDKDSSFNQAFSKAWFLHFYV